MEEEIAKIRKRIRKKDTKTIEIEMGFIREENKLISVEKFAIKREPRNESDELLYIPKKELKDKEIVWVNLTRENKIFVFENVNVENFNEEGFPVDVQPTQKFNNRREFFE